MRGKWIVALAVVCSCMMFTTPCQASNSINDLSPNEYKQNKKKKDMNLMNDQKNIIEKGDIPEEQKNLTFDGNKNNHNEAIKGKLFQQQSMDTNTIKAKADHLQLFSQPESSKLDELEETGDTSSSVSILITIFVTVCLLLLILVLVIWNRTNNQQKASMT
ncbi:type VII secretion protein EssA [Bacillus carboniphilus]|uniref:Type VII secretion protein EssA n=1 Tax=Bacillus carboniphilus TaxID=86663 RepID=A0ABY9JWE1_9BACI|nr:type VII secretion protein EssA [Bacillus carboniphilus]WLR42823.1 type VII secretion protein EssA [Bacillus carboniphilus]